MPQQVLLFLRRFVLSGDLVDRPFRPKTLDLKEAVISPDPPAGAE